MDPGEPGWPSDEKVPGEDGVRAPHRRGWCPAAGHDALAREEVSLNRLVHCMVSHGHGRACPDAKPCHYGLMINDHKIHRRLNHRKEERFPDSLPRWTCEVAVSQ